MIKGNSVQQHQFARNPDIKIRRSMFKRPHRHLTTHDCDYLVPVHVDEVLPGDTHTVSLRVSGRLNTLVNPILDNVRYHLEAFFVPNRIVWSNWTKFLGEQTDPGDSIAYLVPRLAAGAVTTGTIYDYLGLPLPSRSDVNALILRSYNNIVNEWYRDQDLQDSLPVDKGDGPDPLTNYSLYKRAKKHDYFSSARPSPQKGDPLTVPVDITGQSSLLWDTIGSTNYDGRYAVFNNKSSLPDQAEIRQSLVTGGSGSPLPQNSYQNAYVDGANFTATSFSINDFREAYQTQVLLETLSRTGTRYKEILEGVFGVISPDQTLQRPQYLMSSSSTVKVFQVPQTSSSDVTTPQGNLSAYGEFECYLNFKQSFVEHGHIIILGSARADVLHQYGLRRMWSRQTRFDFAWPQLAHLGEQEIYNREIYADGSSTDDDIWGFIYRNDEYRYFPSYVTGLMRSNAAGSLDAWHLAPKYTSRPALSDAWMQSQTPIDRVVAVPSEPDMLVDISGVTTSLRPLPVFGIPGLRSFF